jgi:hypothetical protein
MNDKDDIYQVFASAASENYSGRSSTTSGGSRTSNSASSGGVPQSLNLGLFNFSQSTQPANKVGAANLLDMEEEVP